MFSLLRVALSCRLFTATEQWLRQKVSTRKRGPPGFSVCSVSLFFFHFLIAPQVPKPSCAECQENMTRVPKEEEKEADGYREKRQRNIDLKAKNLTVACEG